MKRIQIVLSWIIVLLFLIGCGKKSLTQPQESAAPQIEAEDTIVISPETPTQQPLTIATVPPTPDPTPEPTEEPTPDPTPIPGK